MVRVQGGQDFRPVMPVVHQGLLQGLPGQGILAVARDPIPAAHQVDRAETDGCPGFFRLR